MPAVSKVTLVRFRGRFVERANLKNLHFVDHPRQQCARILKSDVLGLYAQI